MEICGTDAEWKREMLSLGKLNRVSSDRDDTCVYLHRACQKNDRQAEQKNIWKVKKELNQIGVWESVSRRERRTRTVKAGYDR